MRILSPRSIFEMLKFDPKKVKKFIQYSILYNRDYDRLNQIMFSPGSWNETSTYGSRARFYRRLAEENRSYGIIQKIVDRIII
ncbi:MAG: hypothetical protein GTN36_02260 [Candidatus Aenigmarchaeota archaeon]|nr:hypothetical protein [Candidatus Aenigmarchaeota archaeon]